MPVSAKSLGIDKLDADDRLALVEQIWASVVADAKVLPLTAQQRQELDRRVVDGDAFRLMWFRGVTSRPRRELGSDDEPSERRSVRCPTGI